MQLVCTKHIPDVLVHVTHKDRLAAVLAEGLVPNKQRSTEGGVVSDRVFLAIDTDILQDDTINAAFFKSPDAVTLLVDVSTFKHLLKPDPEWRSYDNHDPEHHDDDLCWFVEGTIAPEFLKLR